MVPGVNVKKIVDLGDQNDQNCHQHLKAFTNTFVFNICHQYQCNIWWWCQFSDFGDGILILMTFQCKESFTDISKSEKICHHYSILSPMILMSHWQELCHSNTPCTYNVVQNINKIIHSDLVFVFLKVRKKNLLNWIFILLIILLIFRVERSGVFYLQWSWSLFVGQRGLTVFMKDTDCI